MSQFETNRKKVFSNQLRGLMDGWKKQHGKKLSQETLGNAVHVSRETVSGWLNCKTLPPAETMEALCVFFGVPKYYFRKENYENGWTAIDEQTHDDLEKNCESISKSIGLSPSLVGFIKENPALADAVISASWVDAYAQSLSPDVPLMPDKRFQLVSSSNVKIYPSPETLYMLRVVQRDLTEYALFLVQKWSKIIDEAHSDSLKAGEITTGQYGSRTSSGKEFLSASQRYELELAGKSSLTPGASLIVDMYNNMSGDEQDKLIDDVRKTYRESSNAQKVRKAVRKARETNTIVPPVSEILKDGET